MQAVKLTLAQVICLKTKCSLDFNDCDSSSTLHVVQG